MNCPKCNNRMDTIDFDGIEVDRCQNCKGIWFDVGESDSLGDRETAGAIDIGDPALGRETNIIDRYRCPRCNGGMMRMVDPKNKEIRYEECTACRGSFFDAGEFADLSGDVVASLLTKVKRPGEG